MELSYLKMVWKIKYRLWDWWHCRLPSRVYGHKYSELTDSRPWWHLCCNGDAGGWRTRVCDWLEGYPNGWRGLEDRAYPYQEEEE